MAFPPVTAASIGCSEVRIDATAEVLETYRGRFDVAPVCASNRLARAVKYFIEVLDELNRINIEFVSFR